MRDNKVTLIGVLFFLFCAALVGGVWYLNGRVTLMSEEYADLERRRVDLDQNIQSLIAQKKVFTDAFAVFEQFKVNAAVDDMAFYSDIQQVVQQASGVNILSTAQRGSRDGRSSLQLTLRGDYYSFMRILADWRRLPTTVRVAGMTVTASRTPETMGEVQVDVTMEAIVGR
jgi:hypothetical protein